VSERINQGPSRNEITNAISAAMAARNVM